jgi:CHAT domain-containing protein
MKSIFWSRDGTPVPKTGFAGFAKGLIVTLLGASCIAAQSPTELLSQADHLAESFNLSKAQPFYGAAEEQFKANGDARNELNARFGLLRYSVQLGSYTASREAIRAILATPLVDGDPQLKIKALDILGTIDLNLNTSSASTDWTTLLATANSVGDAKWANRAKGHLGIVAGLNGDVGGAAKALFQAVSTAETLGDVVGELTFSIWLANGMTANGMGDAAINILDRADSLARKSGYAPMPLQFSIAKVRALSTSSKEISRNEAKALLQSTLASSRQEGILGAQTDLLSQSGQMAMDNHDFEGAEKSFSEQVQVAKQASLPSMEADGLLHLSQIYRSQNNGAKAELAIEEGIKAVRAMQESYDLPRFIAEKAEVELELGYVKEADALYDQATEVIEGLLLNAPSSRTKSSMIGSMSDIYLGHFRLVWNQLHDGPKAFSIIESARGRGLINTLGTLQETDKTVEQSPAERNIAHLQKVLLNSNPGPNGTRRILAQIDHAYDQAFGSEYDQNRNEVGSLRSQPVSIDLLRRRLRPHEAFVEYVLDAKTSYAMEVTSLGLTIHSLPGRSELDRLARSFMSHTIKKTDGSQSAKALYNSIISPIVGDQTASLIVVPDGSLYSLPFGALLNPKDEYLSQRLTVSSAPSATVYYALQTPSRSKLASKPFLGIDYSPKQQGKQEIAVAANTTNPRGLFDLRGANLTALPFAEEEITTAAGMFGKAAVALSGDQASETALKAEPLRDFSVIHFAAHAVGNEVEPDRAGLVFAAGNGTDDGLWQAREIRRTRLNADVIVLSACDTGVGRLQGQEGVMNLARAFLTAGAKSVVASLWEVDDRSTATLMESFYHHLAAGLTVNESLRQAQLDFIRDYGEKAIPYLWAGFEVIGDGTRRINFATDKTVISSAR